MKGRRDKAQLKAGRSVVQAGQHLTKVGPEGQGSLVEPREGGAKAELTGQQAELE